MKQIVLNIRNGEKNTDIAFPCVEEEPKFCAIPVAPAARKIPPLTTASPA